MTTARGHCRNQRIEYVVLGNAAPNEPAASLAVYFATPSFKPIKYLKALCLT